MTTIPEYSLLEDAMGKWKKCPLPRKCCLLKPKATWVIYRIFSLQTSYSLCFQKLKSTSWYFVPRIIRLAIPIPRFSAYVLSVFRLLANQVQITEFYLWSIFRQDNIILTAYCFVSTRAFNEYIVMMRNFQLDITKKWKSCYL